MIRCISPYRSSLGQYAPGDTVDDAALAQALRIDSPGSFELVGADPEPAPAAQASEPVTKPVAEAPRNRAIRGDRSRKE